MKNLKKGKAVLSEVDFSENENQEKRLTDSLVFPEEGEFNEVSELFGVENEKEILNSFLK
jgi:hypothetical protein